ncbi:MAG: FAD-binding protein, partial [Caulobacteraceae bacterium]
RDVVARAIHRQIATGGGAFLDCREAVGAEFPHQFPTVFAACMAAGLDPRISPIPVAPAAHYHMGGVATDEHGRSSLPGLYAAGECARTGVHGANRLASNSLLEAVVFGRRAGAAAAAETAAPSGSMAAKVAPPLDKAMLQHLRATMSRYAGVVRDAAGLARLIETLDELDAATGQTLPALSARLIAEAALARRDSIGAHFRSDAADTSQKIEAA